MVFPGFINPATNSTTLRRAVPFHDDMDMLLGEWSAAGESILWFGSMLSGIVFCKLVRFSPFFRMQLFHYPRRYHFNLLVYVVQCCGAS